MADSERRVNAGYCRQLVQSGLCDKGGNKAMVIRMHDRIFTGARVTVMYQY